VREQRMIYVCSLSE